MKKEEKTTRMGGVHLALVLIAVFVVVIAVASIATDDAGDGELGTVTGKAVADPGDAEKTDKKGELAEVIEKKLDPEPRVLPTIPDGTVMMNEEFSLDGKAFPFVKKLDLEEGARYTVYFESDRQIQFVVYSEFHYNKWKETGFHSIAKATTQSGPRCCETSGSFKFDVNSGEGGTFYLVFDDKKIPDKSQLPGKGKLIVTKNENI